MNPKILALAAAVLTASGCASPQAAAPGPRQGQGSRQGLGERPHGGRGMVFISPMGQPFRGRPGEAYPVAAWFAAADANHDGRLDRAELVADAAAFFQTLDVNGDGVIDSAENSRYETEIAPEILGGYGGGPQAGGGEAAPGAQRGRGGGGRRGGGGGPGGGMGGGRRGGGGQMGAAPSGGASHVVTGGGGAAPYGLLGTAQPVRSADADLSQSVSAAEFRAAAGRRFDKLDTAGKGVLALSDLPQTAVQQRLGKQ